MINLLAMARTTTAAVEHGVEGGRGGGGGGLCAADTGVITVTPTVGGTRVVAVFTNGGYKPQALNSNTKPPLLPPAPCNDYKGAENAASEAHTLT